MSNEGEPRRHVDRAAQFVPFAALTGYYDLIRERANLTLASEPDSVVAVHPDARVVTSPDGSGQRSPQDRPWPRAEPPYAGGTQCGSGRAPTS